MISFLNLANVFLFASGFLMLYTAYRNRRVLRGYNLLGTILIVLAITFFLVFYIQEGFLAQPPLTLPNYGYWLIVGVSLLKNRGERKERL